MMKFEKLDVWKLSVHFSSGIYKMTERFPKYEIYALTQQLRRASQSIALNIAEGSGRSTDREFSRFLDYSIGSTLECVSAFHISLDLKYIDQKTFTTYYQQAETICKKLYAMKKYLRKQSKRS